MLRKFFPWRGGAFTSFSILSTFFNTLKKRRYNRGFLPLKNAVFTALIFLNIENAVFNVFIRHTKKPLPIAFFDAFILYLYFIG
jgi:hypothetical protein